MPIDASIPLRVERHQAPNPLAMLMQIQEMQQRQRYGQDQEEDRKVRREELDFRRQQMAAAGQAQQREAAQAQHQAHIKAVARATVALKGMAPEQRAAAFPQIAQRLKQQGILPADAPEDYAAMGGDPWVDEQFASLMSDSQLAEMYGPQKPAAVAPVKEEYELEEVLPDGTVRKRLVPSAEYRQGVVQAPKASAAEKKYEVTVPGPRGPVKKLFTEAEMAAGVPEYRAPVSAGSTSRSWVLRDGKPVRVAEGEIRPGDTPYSQPRSITESAQDRQRIARMDAARGFLTRLNELREKINTKMGPEAGATGLVRRGLGAVGMDPDVAEYERIRVAGGRSLAVAIMGAQNLSDQDANAWSNMLPGATVDKVTAKRLTDQIDRMLNGMDAPEASGPATGTPKADPLGIR